MYETRLDDYRRLSLPSAYDLSYANVELTDMVEVPGSRYQTVEYATQVGSTNFSDISWTGTTSSYSSLDSNVTLASGFGEGDSVAVHYDYVLTEDEVANLQNTPAAGGAPMESGGGGLFDGLTGAVSTVIGSIAVFLGLKRRGGSN